MFDRDNAIGFLLLGLCVAVGGVLAYGIITGTRVEFSGPRWLGTVLTIVFIGAGLYGFASRRRWPDPLTGRGRRRWPWTRKQDDDVR